MYSPLKLKMVNGDQLELGNQVLKVVKWTCVHQCTSPTLTGLLAYALSYAGHQIVFMFLFRFCNFNFKFNLVQVRFQFQIRLLNSACVHLKVSKDPKQTCAFGCWVLFDSHSSPPSLRVNSKALFINRPLHTHHMNQLLLDRTHGHDPQVVVHCGYLGFL